MIWFLVGGLIALVVWGNLVWENRHESFELALTLTTGLLLAVVTTVLFAMLANLAAGLVVDSKSVEDSRHDLLALNDSISSGGSFFLGTGSVDEQAAFFYYQQGSQGATLEHVDADRALIIEEDIDQPYVAVIDADVSTNFFWYTGGFGSMRYEFHIPQGSINNSFRLDAE